jgi:hypothetical protein
MCLKFIVEVGGSWQLLGHVVTVHKIPNMKQASSSMGCSWGVTSSMSKLAFVCDYTGSVVVKRQIGTAFFAELPEINKTRS